jgi:hypothetical protein
MLPTGAAGVYMQGYEMSGMRVKQLTVEKIVPELRAVDVGWEGGLRVAILHLNGREVVL